MSAWQKVRGAKWKGRAVRVRLGLDGLELRRDRHHEQSAIFVPWEEVLRLAFKRKKKIVAAELRSMKKARAAARKHGPEPLELEDDFGLFGTDVSVLEPELGAAATGPEERALEAVLEHVAGEKRVEAPDTETGFLLAHLRGVRS